MLKQNDKRVIYLKHLRRTWAEISESAVLNNLREIKKITKDSRLCCAVKANCYGHGVDVLAPVFEQNGVFFFAVSNIEEAIQLRTLNIKAKILILGYTPPEFAKELQEYDISQCVYSLEYARSVSRCAVAAGVTVKVHIKFDTGMGRIGFDLRENELPGIDEAILAAKQKNFFTEGVFTHFAVSDSESPEDMEFTKAQFDRFDKGVKLLNAGGIIPEFVHCDNSAAICLDEYIMNMVRPGIILYGLKPNLSFDTRLNLIPVMTLKSVVSFVKTVKKGTSIGYGRTFTAKDTMKIATVAIGYADGYPRALSNKGEVLIGGKKAKVVGNVCMDQLMVDVTGIDDVKTGDEVILWGKDLPLDDIAKTCGTISYEIACNVSPRVPRILTD